MSSTEKEITEQAFAFSKKRLTENMEQLKVIQESFKNVIDKLEKLEKINSTQVEQYSKMFPAKHLQNADAQKTSGLFNSEKTIINDFKQSTSTLSKNYMKWLSEYNTCILKIN